MGYAYTKTSMYRLIKRTIYLGYYLWGLDRKKFVHFLSYAASESGRSKISIVLDALGAVYAYNISLLEYFQFRFYKTAGEDRRSWAGSGYMYEYQLKMNPKRERVILDDKRLFFQKYRPFIKHQAASLKELRDDPALVDSMLKNPSGKLVLKVHDGKCGKQVLVKESKDLMQSGFLSFMEQNGYDVAEEFIVQHKALQDLSSAAVNTIRIFTQLNSENEVVILACRLRISIHLPVDNLAAGNIAAPINTESGRVSGPAVYSDIDKTVEDHHPLTGVKITGFQIPYWKETMEMATEAALLHPQNRSIGWDIAMTPGGPDLIEGNHDWCKLLYQLPAGKGLKPDLEKHFPT